ncbi:MAG TPA: TonB-dependent receptor [Caulobacteraceae bacterium]
MRLSSKSVRARLLVGASAVVLAMSSGAAIAQDREAITIAPQSLTAALQEFGSKTARQVMFSPGLVGSKTSAGVSSATDEQVALAQLLQGTGLGYRREGDVYLIVKADADPQSGSAAGDGAEVEALIVTAQKREEDIQDVPIAISAFTQEDLTRSQVAGGPDLITQVPNMTFTKTNFSSYSVQLRGIGTQAISATTDPAVAVAFNNTPFIHNRFFEQEFYDLQRVEVLRGPQGTLYGRNATAGVVNIISQKPRFNFEAKASADVSNYSSSRIEGMVNIPLVEDLVALRIAGAWTKREGYATNEIDGNQIDGRDLWSTRVSLRFTPSDRLDANLIWEHFEENDDRLRSGKQLCKKHVITEVNGIPVTYFQPVPDTGQTGGVTSNVQSVFSQGCIRNSLYAPDSFQTPNGMSIPYYFQLRAIGFPGALMDPYVSEVQSPDLRVIESTVPPEYRAKADLAELQISLDLTDNLTLASETAYSADEVFSLQDFNRFNTAPGAFSTSKSFVDANGVFCDPQIGCSNRLVAMDISTAEARQFSQEFRLSSSYEGPFNFSLGANFLRSDSIAKYYVFINSLTMLALTQSATPYGYGLNPPPGFYTAGVTDNMGCLTQGPTLSDPSRVYSVTGCQYIDPNPIGALNDQGHNYFLSNNPYKLISYAVFGEAYYNITDNLKVTAGLRFSVDKKEAPRVPSQLLAGNSFGYPVAEVIEQEWREPTGRLVVDWKPDLAFTDETMVYASYAHGYKAGGANPPGFTYVFYGDTSAANLLATASVTRPKTFAPEFVDAFELGTKNTFADGKVTANLAAFYYDYKDYQISEIVDRSAFNRNFDATVWGVEIEADWRPLENLKLGFKGGYQETRIADGERAVDLMDRTAGMEGWSVVRPFPTFASNCILPTWLYTPPGGTISNGGSLSNLPILGLGSPNGGGIAGCEYAYILGLDPVTRQPYTDPPTPGGSFSFWRPGTYPGFDPSTAPNNGEGFFKELGGNELPNAPNWTGTITADYTLPLPNEWLATLHTDLHWQSESYWRIFQDHEFSKLDEYFTMNLAAIFTNEERGWNIMAYIKNVTDETAITGAFLNSDDTGLTTNVFLTEPRLYGLRVTKNWSGGPMFGGFGGRSEGPYALIVELGGQVQKHDAPFEALRPAFADTAPEELDIFGDAQSRDFDTGDGREIKVTWRPGSGPWSASGAYRYGRTNTDVTRLHAEVDTGSACGFQPGHPATAAFCAPDSPPIFGQYLLQSGTAWTAAWARSQEDHQLVDFAVGYDVGLGGLSRSTVSAGLRYAQLSSKTNTEFFGAPDRYIADGHKYNGHDNAFTFMFASPYTRYQGKLSADRDFEGTGPVMSWDAAAALLSGSAGQVELDWSLSAGALFGKQRTFFEQSGTAEDRLYNGGLQDDFRIVATNPLPPLGVASRSEDVTAGILGASLGLAYSIDRVRIGAGYRWERYSDVLDIGFAEHQDGDRTIDGPYFKLSVGFGGS